MLPCVCSVMDRISGTLSNRDSFWFLSHFDVICDQLLNRRRATWNLFVRAAKYEIQKLSTCRAALFRCKFRVNVWRFSPYGINSACCATKDLLRVEESFCEKQSAGLLLATNFGVVTQFFINSQLVLDSH